MKKRFTSASANKQIKAYEEGRVLCAHRLGAPMRLTQSLRDSRILSIIVYGELTLMGDYCDGKRTTAESTVSLCRESKAHRSRASSS